MKFILFIIGIAIAINIKDVPQTTSDIEKLKQDNVGSFLMDLAQLHGQTIGPLDDLKVAINKLDDDLQEQLKTLEAEFTQKTAYHNKIQQQLELIIGQAQIEIAQSQDTVDNFLTNTKDNYETRLQEVKENIADNRQKVDRSKLERQKEAKQSIDRIHEHSMATNAIDEALQLVMGLINGNIGFAEAPMRETIDVIESRVSKREEFGPMIDALVNMSANGVDQRTVKDVRDLLNKLRSSIVDSLNKEMGSDKEKEQQFNERLEQLDKEYREFQKQINEFTYNLTAFMNRIETEQSFQQARKSDLDSFNEQKDLENSNYAEESSLYQDIKNALLKEIQTVGKAKEVVQSGQFQDLVKSKSNKGLSG